MWSRCCSRPGSTWCWRARWCAAADAASALPFKVSSHCRRASCSPPPPLPLPLSSRASHCCLPVRTPLTIRSLRAAARGRLPRQRRRERRVLAHGPFLLRPGHPTRPVRRTYLQTQRTTPPRHLLPETAFPLRSQRPRARETRLPRLLPLPGLPASQRLLLSIQ